jgi:hypothetical protein
MTKQNNELLHALNVLLIKTSQNNTYKHFSIKYVKNATIIR